MPNLKQTHHGVTDISEFSEPRTMVLWSSFMTGKNLETKILAKGDKEMWNTRIDHKNTFFSKYEKPMVVDLPGYNYDLEQHERSRSLLKAYFKADDDQKEELRKKYNENAFEHHRKIKKQFLNSLNKGYDFLLGYFSVADEIGHLNFGNKIMMKMIYKELDEIVSQINGNIIVLSDHGMKAIGYFGDHSDYGFWSTNF
ncbi:MAG: alkaline phosphatase family protein, partial [Thermoplasmata archaeon]|nr:alkaline phosphatase family protein [Thermoplasmata archaeon]